MIYLNAHSSSAARKVDTETRHQVDRDRCDRRIGTLTHDRAAHRFPSNHGHADRVPHLIPDTAKSKRTCKPQLFYIHPNPPQVIIPFSVRGQNDKFAAHFEENRDFVM